MPISVPDDTGRFKLFARRHRGPAGLFHVLELVGRVDSGNASLFESELTRIVGLGGPVVVDCSRLDFMASSGLRALVRGARSARSAFRVVGLKPNVRGVLAATGIDRIVDVRRSLAVAFSDPA